MRFHLRGFTSLVLSLSFLALAFSGVLLYLTPRGQIAHWNGWTLLGLSKDQWSGLHTNFAVLFLVASGVHWFLNWDRFWHYLKAKNAPRVNLVGETIVAVLLTVVFALGTLWLVPPFETVIWGSERMKTYWADTLSRPPTPHAEDFSMERFASTIGLSYEQVKAALEQEGYRVDSPKLTVHQVADQRRVAPSDVLEAVQKHHPEASAKPRGRGQGRGLGRGQGQGRAMNRGE